MHINNIEEGITTGSLINILNYIFLSRLKIDVINLSLGISSCEDKKRLYDACKRLTDLGVVIVSAFNNDGSISYPAAFDNAIGVVSGARCNSVEDFETFDNEVVNIAAKGSMQRLIWTYPKFIFMSGNSFACAHVTNKVIEFMYQGTRNQKEIIEKIKSTAKYHHISSMEEQNNSLESIPFKIKKAVLFPFNKEMHSLIRFRDLLGFEVVEVFDTKYSMTLGATTSHLLKHDGVSYKIKSINDIIWDNFDTLIVGHTNEISNMTKSTFKEDLIEEAIKRNKNIYSYDNIVGDVGNSLCGKMFYPQLKEHPYELSRLGMMYKCTTPVLAVLGTSSSQGKFTLQLTLRRKFLENGYNIGQIGTEPTSLLFGMDYVVPMGYNSTSAIQGNDLICYLNGLINELEDKNKDLIIAGTQAGTVLYEDGNISRYNVDLYSFLLGVNPDAVILCVNPFDTIDYIKRTIGFIESSVNTKVVALVVFPMNYKDGYFNLHNVKIPLSNSDFEDLQRKLTAHINLPTLKLGDKFDMESLFDLIINYFSQEEMEDL